jgi:hypothetical protein
MRTALQTTSCVVDPLGQFETLKEVTATTITLPERVDVLLLGCQRAMLAEMSILIVICWTVPRQAEQISKISYQTPS